MRRLDSGGDADGRLPVLLDVPGLREGDPPAPGRLLRLLLMRGSALSAEAVRRRLLLAGFFRLDLRDHQDIAVGIGQLHLLRRPRGSVLDLAGVDPAREQLLAQRGQVV